MKISDIHFSIPISVIEPDALNQIYATASLPFVERMAVMPDVHLGIGSTIGTVIVTRNTVIPAAVGVDIGCGMTAVHLNNHPTMTQEELESIYDNLLRSIPVGIGQRGMHTKVTKSTEALIKQLETRSEFLFHDRNHMDIYFPDWRKQLGTLGGGNHFIEICKGVSLDEPDLTKSTLWVTVHSGSRGVGNKCGTDWIKEAKAFACSGAYIDLLPNPDLAYLTTHSQPGIDYMKEVEWCMEYARLNRMDIANAVLDQLAFYTDVDIDLEFDCSHNHVRTFGYNTMITRKGAVSAMYDELALLPGSMGRKSYVVRGLATPSGLFSGPHGAGRSMSRKAARDKFTVESLAQEMKGVVAGVRGNLCDEHPDAYKSIDEVIKFARPYVEPLYVLTPLLNVKGD